MDSLELQIREIMQGDDAQEQSSEKETASGGDTVQPGDEAIEEQSEPEASSEVPETGIDPELEAGDTPEVPDSVDEDLPETIDLTALAESVGVTPEELYQVEIPLGGDLPATTLGDLKDRYQDTLNLEEEREQFTRERDEQQLDMLAGRRELQQIVAMLGDSISPELIAAARQEHGAMIARERDNLREALPAWQDPEIMQAERAQVKDLLTKYSFSDVEQKQVYDARIIRLVRDAALAFDKLERLQQQAETGRTMRTDKASALKRGQQQTALKKKLEKAKTGNRQEKVSAIGDLIRGTGQRGQ